ncbi:YfiT family bacillithiol transferase [Mucilaginibacter sp. dw_454]|uniref:YfiT family bacillithiol transferase n=1 Tax=Mucilaginibacter sp. dw_454 TaxID=2720079 RepID=UPI001BD2D91F|nr:putative metal-dependent hydrolase [Mucilaginibacter sp. dw_454]
MSTTQTIDPLQYPVGKFVIPETYSPEAIQGWINVIRELPAKMRTAVTGLTDEQLATQYRPGGWTIRQVVHHVADSHMNSIIRFKWALTEDTPTIKAYDQVKWAQLADYKLPIESSLIMLEGIHQHLVALFESFTDEQWNRHFIHPETGAEITLKRNLALYAWHSQHHLAHITNTVTGF